METVTHANMQAADLHVTGRSPDSLSPRGRLLDCLPTLHTVWLPNTKVGGAISTNYTIGVAKRALSDVGRAGVTQKRLRVGVIMWRPHIVCDSPSINTACQLKVSRHIVCGNSTDIQRQSHGNQFSGSGLPHFYSKVWPQPTLTTEALQGLAGHNPHSDQYWYTVDTRSAQTGRVDRKSVSVLKKQCCLGTLVMWWGSGLGRSVQSG